MTGYERLALIANETAEITAKLEELERLREQVRKAELKVSRSQVGPLKNQFESPRSVT